MGSKEKQLTSYQRAKRREKKKNYRRKKRSKGSNLNQFLKDHFLKALHKFGGSGDRYKDSFGCLVSWSEENQTISIKYPGDWKQKFREKRSERPRYLEDDKEIHI